MLNKLLRLLHWLEDSVLVTLVLAMLLLSVGQIALRNLGFSGFLWAETASRIMVLWLAMFGAMRASRMQNHIAIDLFSHYTGPRLQRAIHLLTSLFAAAVCSIAAYYSWQFVVLEMEDGGNAFLKVPAWFCEAIIPFSLAVIGLRFLLHSVRLPAPREHHA